MILPGSLMELQAPGPQSVETKYKAGERKRAVVVVKYTTARLCDPLFFMRRGLRA